MKAKIIQLNPDTQEAAVTEAAGILRRGGIIVYPTDTQYGLGTRYDQEEAIGKIFKIKARDAGKPVPVLIGSAEEAGSLVSEITPLADFLIRKFWPGPLTIVFRASDTVSPRLTGKEGKIGLRYPASPFVNRLVRLTGAPLTATSANLSGRPPVVDADEAADLFWDQVDLILDGGTLLSEPSTVVDAAGEKMIILRQGKLKLYAEAG